MAVALRPGFLNKYWPEAVINFLLPTELSSSLWVSLDRKRQGEDHSLVVCSETCLAFLLCSTYWEAVIVYNPHTRVSGGQ